MYICGCKQCQKAKRRGLILGSRRMGFWRQVGEAYEYCVTSVSAYVPFAKFARGHRVRRPNAKKDFSLD